MGSSRSHEDSAGPGDRTARTPRDTEELLRRARLFEGKSLAELEREHGAAAPGAPSRRKGAIGMLMERALGAAGGSSPGPDFPALGVELKTIPLDLQGRAHESTFVCSLSLRAAQELDYEASPLFAKLRCVLWIPILDSAERGGARAIGRAVLWRPTPEQAAVLRADYDDLVGMIALGNIEGLSARLGRWLQVRPKAANGRARTRALNHDGEPLWTMPRGFYLRARFTTELMRDHATLAGAE